MTRVSTENDLQDIANHARTGAERSRAADLLGVMTITTPAADSATEVQAIERAAAYFQQAIEADPTNYAAKLNLELLLRLERPAKARFGPDARGGFGSGGSHGSRSRRRRLLIGISFLTPLAGLFALTAAVPLAALALMELRTRRLRRLFSLRTPRRRELVAAAVALALVPALVGVAAAQPVVIHRQAVTERVDAQVYLVFDTSLSMSARTGPHGPTRLARAKREAEALIPQLGNIPVGIATLTDRVLPSLLPTDERPPRAEDGEPVGEDRRAAAEPALPRPGVDAGSRSSRSAATDSSRPASSTRCSSSSPTVRRRLLRRSRASPTRSSSRSRRSSSMSGRRPSATTWREDRPELPARPHERAVARPCRRPVARSGLPRGRRGRAPRRDPRRRPARSPRRRRSSGSGGSRSGSGSCSPASSRSASCSGVGTSRKKAPSGVEPL